MKQIYLIGGPMGVGKTAICRQMKAKLPNSVFLDGDWCWDMNPFVVNEETKRMVMDNICCLLNNFIGCSVYEHVIFCWVMHEQEIIDEIVERLSLAECRLHQLSLVCEPEVLKQHLQKDIDRGIRTEDIVARSLARLELYQALDTVKIDVSGLSEAAAAEAVIRRGV